MAATELQLAGKADEELQGPLKNIDARASSGRRLHILLARSAAVLGSIDGGLNPDTIRDEIRDKQGI